MHERLLAQCCCCLAEEETLKHMHVNKQVSPVPAHPHVKRRCVTMRADTCMLHCYSFCMRFSRQLTQCLLMWVIARLSKS